MLSAMLCSWCLHFNLKTSSRKKGFRVCGVVRKSQL